MNITYEDLEKGKVKLEFGNMDQANILRKKEDEVAKLKKALKAPSLSMEYKDKTMCVLTVVMSQNMSLKVRTVHSFV